MTTTENLRSMGADELRILADSLPEGALADDVEQELLVRAHELLQGKGTDTYSD